MKARRVPLRLKWHDYTDSAVYFITICTHQRLCLFGNVTDGHMQLNNAGQIVERCWQAVPEHFPYVEAGASVVMPNHIHGVLVLNKDVRRGLACQTPTEFQSSDTLPRRFGKPQAKSLGTVIGSFKSAASRSIRSISPTPVTVWQRNYYEHIVRTEADWDKINDYIEKNPQMWKSDTLFSD